MTSALITQAPDVAGPAQHRPTGAKMRKALSLRLRLALLVALSTFVVIGIEAYLEIRVFEREVERDLLETARLTALAVADDYELRIDPIDRAALAADLHEFVLTTPSLRTLSIVEVADDTPTVVASTSSEERSEALTLALRAVGASSTLSGSAPPGGAAVAVPVSRPGGARAAAVATVSLASLGQLRTKGRRVTLWFTPAAILVLTLLVDWLSRTLIHRPIGNIRETMTRAGQGDFTARTEVVRQDEIGAVAIGLNDMLRRLQDFNEALQERVDEATTELRMRNEELVETYQRVFALREAVARNEQLAAVGQMAASVAHQVGTPLNLISGYVQMLQEQAAAEPRTSRRLEIVQEQIEKVSTVVRTLLDHARRPEERRAVDLSMLLSRVADVAGPKLDSSGISAHAPGSGRPSAHLGGCGGTRARAAEPDYEQSRRNVGGRNADHQRDPAPPDRPDRDQRHRDRYPGRAPAPHLPALGDDQADGPRHRARPQHHRRRHCQARRHHSRGERTGTPHDLHDRAARDPGGGETSCPGF